MQKVTYVLLQRHANSYWQTERDEEIRSGRLFHFHIFVSIAIINVHLPSVTSPAKRRRPATICAVSEGKEPFPGLNEMMSKLAEREKTSDVSNITPGIQHHPLPTQTSVSRPPSNATLRPVIPEREITINHHHSTTNNTTLTTIKDENPPPVPPKPIVIRADQMLDSNSQQWQFTPVQQRRQTLW